MSNFDYIIEKIEECSFSYEPFKCLKIDDFLSEEHFEMILNDKQVHFGKKSSTSNLLEHLEESGYRNVGFPGCTKNKKKYLEVEKKLSKWNFEKKVYPTDSLGMAYRLEKHANSFTESLISFMNGKEFKETLIRKFNLEEEVLIHTSIQKYLNGYEISPHPDIRTKALTYLLNINKDLEGKDRYLHTHLLEFKEKFKCVGEFWKRNLKKNTCWVPWDWCSTKEILHKNNSIIIFEPSYNTLHGVKLKYSHLESQRTQIYGNLNYKKVSS